MSSEVAIHAQNLGKRYYLGARLDGRLTLRELIHRAAVSPYKRLQAVAKGVSAQVLGDELWALRDVSFSVAHGEVLGVIGRNGAGKSTLLKLLSRITDPTQGRVEIHGRVGSLLEVGTGFHSELTGRENIFLNGVILGMTRKEISSKLDEIVAFAEIDRFLDTQVKHYSSGMSLRLGFAVAAHFQPEILLVDEVLAVGDASFQRKCLGKMSDVASHGRAILFVSHNLEAVQRLCDRCIWLDGGRVRMDGEPNGVVRAYLEQDDGPQATYRAERRSSQDQPVVLREAAILDGRGAPARAVCFGDPFALEFHWDVAGSIAGAAITVQVHDSARRLIFTASTHALDLTLEPGTTSICRVHENVLLPGDYTISVACNGQLRTRLDHAPDCLRLRVLDVAVPGRTLPYLRRDALVAPDTRWQVRQTATAMVRQPVSSGSEGPTRAIG